MDSDDSTERPVALALEVATSLSRQRDVQLIVGPIAPAALSDAGLSVPATAQHRDGTEDLEVWMAATSHVGDLLVMPLHDTSIGPAAVRVHRTGRSVVAVSQNPETSAASVVSPMNLPVGRSLGA